MLLYRGYKNAFRRAYREENKKNTESTVRKVSKHFYFITGTSGALLLFEGGNEDPKNLVGSHAVVTFSFV